MVKPLSPGKKSLFVAIMLALFFVMAEGGCRLIEHLNFLRRRIDIPAKAPDEIRIFAYGGSTVYGIHDPAVGFVAQLRFWLVRNFPGNKINVVNFGKPGKDSSYVVGKIACTIHNQPDFIIVLTGHNEYLKREYPDHFELRFSDGYLASVRLLTYCWRKIFNSNDRSPFLPEYLDGYDCNSAFFKEKKRIYRRNISAMVQLARRYHVPLLISTAPSNLMNWSPVYCKLRGLSPSLQQSFTRWHQLLEQGQIAEVSREMALLPDQARNQAMALYLRGRLCASSGQDADAARLLTQAKDLDPYPWRALSEFNAVIIRHADSGAGVYLVDGEQALRRDSANGIIDDRLIVDNCHPTPFGNAILAGCFIDAILDNRLVVNASTASRYRFALFQQHADFFKLPQIRANYFLTVARYCMLTPFFHYGVSRRCLLQAEKLEPRNWQIAANLATLALLQGHKADGIRYLRRAIQLKGGFPNLDDKAGLPYLKQALEQMQLNIRQFD